jgi:hypothetical protein
MIGDDREQPVSEEAFALLGHDIRLDILRAFFQMYEPVDPESLPDMREQRSLSYGELMTEVGMEDSGKFNYHLEKLRGVYIEKVEAGYVPTASAIALYEAMVANRPTKTVSTDFFVDERCPNCESRLRGEYEQEFLSVDCPTCDLFWGATYRFPKNGLAVREDENVFEVLYDRMMYHVGLARTGQCPSCAGKTSVVVPRERLNGDSTPTVELSCGTCSWFVTVDIVSALQFEPQVTNALCEIGLPLNESSSMQTTEQVLPDISGRVDSESPLHATITIRADGDIAKIIVDDSLEILSTTVK